MAEKEERIYVRQYGEDNPCDTCEDKSGEECDFCVENYEWNASITRAEAIERMAKALYLFNREDEWYKEHADMYSKFMNKMAEAALNALLEGK